jgi:hypothetical protein
MAKPAVFYCYISSDPYLTDLFQSDFFSQIFSVNLLNGAHSNEYGFNSVSYYYFRCDGIDNLRERLRPIQQKLKYSSPEYQ